MRRSFLLLAAVPLTVTACSGPTKPINIGVQNLATSFHYGLLKAAVSDPALPGAAPAPSRGTFAPIQSIGYPELPDAPSSRPPVVVTPPASCPEASTIAIVRRPVTNTITKPPAAAKYTFRTTGAWQDGGGAKGEYPASETREVKDPKLETNGNLSFTVVTVLGDETTTTSYSYVAPTAASRSAVGPEPVAGLYLTGTDRKQGGKVKTSFHPQGPGLLLMEAPTLAKSTWQSTATDATNGTTEAVSGTIGASTLVNACGDVIQAVPVHLDGTVKVYQPGLLPQGADTGVNAQGQDVSPDGVVSFTADYVFAPQYGGLIVQDKVRTTATVGGKSLKTSLQSVINTLPIAP